MPAAQRRAGRSRPRRACSTGSRPRCGCRGTTRWPLLATSFFRSAICDCSLNVSIPQVPRGRRGGALQPRRVGRGAADGRAHAGRRLRAHRACRVRGRQGCPPPPPPRTNRTRRVPHPTRLPGPFIVPGALRRRAPTAAPAPARDRCPGGAGPVADGGGGGGTLNPNPPSLPY